MTTVRLNAQRVIADLDELGARSGGRFAGAKRLAWTREWRETRTWLEGKLAEAGLDVEVDAAGNLWAQIVGEREEFVIVGSHLDAVPDGGWLDGALGVLAALEAVRQLARSESRPPLGVRFVEWADEEGARFGISLVGSSACAGTLNPAQVRDLVDPTGVRLAQALSECGIDVDSMRTAQERLRGAVAYLELHVEQGPVLLEAGRLAAAVSGTFGVERHVVSFVGQASHAGSTPMRTRRDSLAAAARAALTIRQSAIDHGGVATVGNLASSPGVVTAVAGRTEMQLDQRHLNADALAAMLDDAREACETAAGEFGCTVTLQRIFGASPTLFDEDLVKAAREAVRDAGGEEAEAIPSGALHDATEIGRVVPTAMIFVQSDPPVSHAPIEDSPQPAIELAIDAYGRSLAAVLSRADEFTRTTSG